MKEKRIIKIWDLLEESDVEPEEALDYIWQFDPETAKDTSISVERSAEIGTILDLIGVTHEELDEWLHTDEVDSYLVYGVEEQSSR